MNNKQKKFFNKFNFLKFLFLYPLLISIPFFTNINNELKAGLEFQWDQDSGYRKLKWFQKDEKRRSKNTIFFFLRPSDRRGGILKITMKIPKNFKSSLKEEKISLCQVRIGGFETRTKCLKEIPADIEINEDNTSLDIFPYSPIPSNKDSYAVVFKLTNPNRSGLNQFHSFGQLSGAEPVSRYLGSWTIVID